MAGSGKLKPSGSLSCARPLLLLLQLFLFSLFLKHICFLNQILSCIYLFLIVFYLLFRYTALKHLFNWIYLLWSGCPGLFPTEWVILVCSGRCSIAKLIWSLAIEKKFFHWWRCFFVRYFWPLFYRKIALFIVSWVIFLYFWPSFSSFPLYPFCFLSPLYIRRPRILLCCRCVTCFLIQYFPVTTQFILWHRFDSCCVFSWSPPFFDYLSDFLTGAIK